MPNPLTIPTTMRIAQTAVSEIGVSVPGHSSKKTAPTSNNRCKQHQNDEVPEVNVLAHNQLVFAHNFTSIQIECWEDNNPSQIDKVPVETEVFDSLCVLLVPLNRVGLEDHVEHDQQSSEDVNTVCTGCHIED